MLYYLEKSSRVRNKTEPHWERGYRCHGYWLGDVLIGLVYLGPRRNRVPARDGYGWYLDKGQTTIEGKTKTLKAAKKAVELEYYHWCSSGDP